MLFLEDLVPGEEIPIGRHVFGEEETRTFADAWDPLARAARAGERTAVSGIHLGATWMGMWARYMARAAETAADPRLKEGIGGPAPGIEGLVFPVPCPVGEPVDFFTRVLEKRASASRPGWGLARRENAARLAGGQTVMRFQATAFVRRRPD